MKRALFFILILLSLQACEDTVDVNLDTEDPRLVIEATGLQNEQDSTGQLRVLLTKTAPYFDDSIPTVSQADIQLEINNEVIDVPESAETPGTYEQTIPLMEEEDYKLTVEVEGEKYEGKTQLYSTVPIDTIEQEEGIFSSDDVLLKIFYTDPSEMGNYYLFSYDSKHGKALSVSDDEFYNGNQVSTLYQEEFNPGDSIGVRIHGTGKNFNRYIAILLEQSNPENNPFATAPTTVRGNMVNVNHPEEFPLGYFRISQMFETIYVVE